MKYLLIFLPFLAFGQNCPDDFWKQAVLAGEQTIEIQLRKGQGYKPVIIERNDTTKVETWVLTKKTTANPVVTSEIIDDANALVKYTSTWHPFTGSPYNAGTARYTLSTGATATLSFTGNRVEYWAEKRFNHGTAGVKIDSQPEVLVSLYHPKRTNESEMIFGIDLPQGPHTITVRMAGQKDAPTTEANKETNIILDYFKVFKAQ